MMLEYLDSHDCLLLDPLNLDSDSDLHGLPHSSLVLEPMGEQRHLFPWQIDLRGLSDAQRKALADRHSYEASSGVAPAISGLISTSATFGETHGHLGRRLRLHVEGEPEALFRYYDPRVFRHLLRILGPRKQRSLYGPITKWSYCLLGKGWVTEAAPQIDDERSEILSSEEALALGRIVLVNAVHDELERAGGFTASMDAMRRIDVLLQRGQDRHKLDGVDLIAYVQHSMTIHPDLDAHPEVDDLIKRSADERGLFAAMASKWGFEQRARISSHLGLRKPASERGYQ
ncbi:DUF4123 domain-containing protein [Cupriavidus basilensis]|uniref:DUF4123 domain-containing protein n=1 Tax=Cupriavidus basilensis TaxID=68895 RepID=UPI0005BD3F07|nr:DUF4123 domain-containing protein [Cupriavidus basilensis]